MMSAQYGHGLEVGKVEWSENHEQLSVELTGERHTTHLVLTYDETGRLVQALQDALSSAEAQATAVALAGGRLAVVE